MRYVLLLSVMMNTKAYAECALNTDLPSTLEESIKAHPERFDSYKLQRTPVETALKAISKKYGVEAKKEIIPALDKNETSRTCVH